MTAGKITAALLAGLAAGSVVSLLYVPQAGHRTRGQLRNSINALSHTIKNTVAGQVEKLKRLFLENLSAQIRSALGVSVTERYPDYLDQAFI